jgi:hypothetical protein
MSEESFLREVLRLLEGGERKNVARALARLVREEEQRKERLQTLRSKRR